MRKPLCWAGILSWLVAAPAWAAVGDLKPISIDPRKMAAAGFEPEPIYTRDVVGAPEGCGTVHPRARVATLAAPGLQVTVALDSAEADANHPDLVRFDFTGTCRFQGAPTVRLKRGLSERTSRRSGLLRGGEYYHFGPATRKAPCGGTTRPVSVTGEYFAGSGDGKWRYVWLTLVAATEGSCRLGGKVCGVRVVDGTNNLRFGDGLGMTQKDGRVVHADQWRGFLADRVWIDTTSETFRSPKVRVSCGQLARVGGTRYRLRVREDGLRISAEPAGVGIGRVLLPGDKWSVTLVGTGNVLRLRGGKAPVDVPADRYVAAGYEASFQSGVANKPHRIRSGSYVLAGRQKGKVFNVKAGEVTSITVGGPLTATVAVSQAKGTVRLNALVTDASGARVSSLYGPKGKPPAPKVTIYNDKRERIYSTSLKYG